MSENFCRLSYGGQPRNQGGRPKTSPHFRSAVIHVYHMLDLQLSYRSMTDLS